LRVREIDAPEVLQAAADMEKKSSDSFHYYHFLRNAAEPERQDAPEAPPAPAETEAQPAMTDELFKQIAG
jgi:hypothetical protein